MSTTNSDKLADLHAEMMREFNASYEASWTIREEAKRARRFVDVPGAQWDDWLGEQFQNRPRPEVNKLARAVDRIYNEYRNNRITVDFRPKTSGADDEMADLLDDMYRADEQDSGAQEAYDNAIQEGIKGGYGGWRLCTEYEDHEDEDNERQCIKILPITDVDSSLFFNVGARRADKADAKWGFLIYGMTPAAYKREYPDFAALDFPRPLLAGFDWCTPNFVYVAEVYRVQEHKVKVLRYTGLAGDTVKVFEDDLTPEKAEELRITGYTFESSRKLEKRTVRKYIINGGQVIEDCGIIAGEYIPLIPYYGNRSVIDGVERVWGLVKNGKDAQQLYNMQVGVIAEQAALGQMPKPIFHPEQMVGHENTWAYDNIQRNPYLLINMIKDAQGQQVPGGPIGYTQPPVIPQAVSALLEITNRDMMDVTGNQDQAQQVNPNVSAQAIQLVQNRLDMGVFGYIDAMAKSMRQCGTVWLSMRKDIETEPRKVRTLGRDGSQGSADIMVPSVDEKTGAPIMKNDLSSGKYDVAVDVGPSFTTRRDATVANITALIQATPDPQQQALLAGMAIMNMDGEGLDDLRKYQRKQLVRQGVITPNEEEKAQLQEEAQNAQPDPQAQFFLAEAEKSKGLAIKAQADAGKAAADTELAKAKTAETLAGIETSKLDSVLAAIAQLMQAQQQAAQQQQTMQPTQEEATPVATGQE